MKILLICRGDPFSTPAGTEILVGNLALELSRKGHEISLIYEGLNVRDPSLSNVTCVKTHELRLLGIPYVRSLDFRRKCSKHCVDLIKESKIDAVIASGAGTFSGYVFNKIKKLKSRPLLIFYAMDTMKMEYERCKATKEGNGPLARFKRWIWYTGLISSDITSCLNSDLILASSKDTANHLVAEYDIPSNKIILLYEGIPDGFADGIDIIDPDTPTFLHIAGGPRKGTDFFLKAMLLLKEKYGLKAKAIITRMNSTQVKQGMKLGIDAELYEYVPSFELKRLYASCTALVSPSLSEGFCLPVIEAAMFGKLAIVSNVGSLPELVVDGESGFVVSAADVSTLVEKMYAVSTDEQLRKRLGYESLKTSRRFTISQVASTLLQLVELYQKSNGNQRN